MSAIIERRFWSKSSQRSSGGHYDEQATHYENISYRCHKCFAQCLFTDAAQKNTYEVEKKFIWWFPSLCAQCQTEVNSLIQKDCEYQKQWQENKIALMSNSEHLENWLAILEAIPAYGKKSNSSMKVKLKKCLKNIGYENPPNPSINRDG